MNNTLQYLVRCLGWDLRHLPERDLAAMPDTVDDATLQGLLESLIVPETWFMRDREPFEFLTSYARRNWLKRAEPCRMLSVPCASGEEPYSIVMALMEAGLPAGMIQVDAVDISCRLLAAARTAIYNGRSFREPGQARYADYFQPLAPDRRQVRPALRAAVRFIRGNAMALDECDELAPRYDAVFCRNLLIYQHHAARRQVWRQLARRLDKGALVFVGHAEMLSLFASSCRPVPHRGAFAYYYQSSEDAAPAPPTPVPSSAGRTEPTLAEARALADAGRLDEAAVMCRKLVERHPLDAAVRLLQGIVLAAAGQMDAAEYCLERALYLDAQSTEALLHLALLKEKRGDGVGAGLLRQRLRRTAGDNCRQTAGDLTGGAA
ncbi:MAG: CheR family methyltransferase [Kiritimatiellia bacterium]